MGLILTHFKSDIMKNHCINIAILGLGLITTDDIKKRLRNRLPKEIDIKWTNIADTQLDLLLINDVFFENNHIQKVINENKTPYLKLAKHSDQIEQNDPNLLCIPITDESVLNKFIENYLNYQPNLAYKNKNTAISSQLISYHFFSQIYQEYSRKLLISDQGGTLALIDHHAHYAWPDKANHSLHTDTTIRYADAITSDLLKISRKNQTNLENWIFELIWNSTDFIAYPEPEAYFKLLYWPQPTLKDRKVILQMSASFSLGAQVEKISQNFNIPLVTVQKFIIANQSIHNIKAISSKDARFGNRPKIKKDDVEPHIIKNFFHKLKRRFGF